MIEKILIKYGLSEKEAKVYLSLLGAGKSVVSDIAKHALINRSTAYVVLESLIEKGLVNTTEENKVKRYTATPPSNLARTIEESIAKQNALLADVQKVMPKLETLFEKERGDAEGKPELQVYEGKAGIKSIYEKLLEYTGEVRMYVSKENKEAVIPHYFENFYKTFFKQNNNVKAILGDEEQVKVFKEGGAKTAVVSRHTNAQSAEIILAGDLVIAIAFDQLYGVVFENAVIANTYKELFELSWNEAKRLNVDTSSHTPLFKTDRFAEKGFTHVYVKDESKNTYGTIKDRKSRVIVNRARLLSVDKLALITAGNNGYSLAKFAGDDALVHCLVDKALPDGMKEELNNVADKVIEVDLKKKIFKTEDVVTLSRESDEETIWDVTNGFVEGYADVVDEIVADVVPDYIVIPVGSGGIYLGIVQRVQELGLSTKVIGVGVKNASQSIADKLFTPSAWYKKAIERCEKDGHSVYRLTEKEVQGMYEKYYDIAAAEPSSTVVYAALDKHAFGKNDKIVFVNTGRSKVSSRSDSRFFLTHFGE